MDGTWSCFGGEGGWPSVLETAVQAHLPGTGTGLCMVGRGVRSLRGRYTEVDYLRVFGRLRCDIGAGYQCKPMFLGQVRGDALSASVVQVVKRQCCRSCCYLISMGQACGGGVGQVAWRCGGEGGWPSVGYTCCTG